ncbi:hypothetical protein FACS1894216_01010 [Synergistales bacterium]|nr:hypothetical protein FACS1894216_01010 [Synergistales bacterium]
MALNTRQKAFVAAYAGNATEAATNAGYSEGTAYSIGQRLLKHVEVAEAIRSREERETRKRIADRQARQIFWTAIMRDENAEVKDRLRASELLGKSEGDFIERTEITGKNGAPVSTIDFSTRSTEELIAIVEAGRNTSESCS